MNDDVQKFAGGPVNCTANDIRIARADVSSVDGNDVTPNTPIQCTPGTNITIAMTAVLEATSNKRRDDIGVWIATDGGDALTGQCRHYNLVAGSPGTVNGSDGTNTETPDACAGMAAGAQTTLDLDTFSIPCNPIQQDDGTLALKIGSCLAWKVPGQDELCPRGFTTPAATYTADDFRAATIPGTPAKCNCEGFLIPVEIVSKITIVKDAVPNNAQDFGYTATGAGMSNFSLDDDADATLSNTKVFSGLVNNGTSRVITENALPTGWSLTNLSCSSTGSHTSTIDVSGATATVTLKAGEDVTCTYTNTASASLDVEKSTVGGTGSFDYVNTGTGISNFSRSTTANNPSQTAPVAFSGTDINGDKYIQETVPTGWSLTNITCTANGATVVIGSGGSGAFVAGANTTFDAGDNTVKVTLAPGSSPSCVFENTKAGTITIIKDAIPNDAQDFAFTSTVPGNTSFSLDDDADATLSNTKTMSVVPGSYTVTEPSTTGWDLTNIACVDPTTNSSGVIATGIATINVAAGETVTCTYTNTKRGSITITKVTVPGSDPQDFAYTTTGTGLSSFSLDTDAGDATISNTHTFTNLIPGNYSVTESATTGWDLTNLTCGAGGTPSGSTANIVVPAGGNVSCTYTNTKRGSITITKVTVPGSDPQDFAYTTSGTGLSSFSLDTDAGDATISNTRTFTNLVSGNYSVTESATTGWDLTNLTCGAGGTPSGSTANIVLPAGGSVSCTYTNTKRGTIIIKKETDPDGVAGSFPFTQNIDASGGFNLSDNGSKTFTNVVPNTGTGYTVTEGSTTGFSLKTLSCDNPDAANASTTSGAVATIRVNAGETVTCTYTNLQLASLSLLKVENGGRPLTQAWAFELRTGASTLATGTTLASASADLTTGVVTFSGFFTPGNNYQLCEVGMPAGYSNNISGFTPLGATPEGGDNSTECINITLVSGANGPDGITGVPNPIDNIRPPGGDARTIGYWKNWTSCSNSNGKQYSRALERNLWDKTLDGNLPQTIGLLVLGGAPAANQPAVGCADAVDILNKSNLSGKKMASDPAYNMAAQLLAAKLNYTAGAKQCQAATDAIAGGQALLEAISFDGTGTYKNKMTAQQIADANSYATTLDKYNNNLLCS